MLIFWFFIPCNVDGINLLLYSPVLNGMKTQELKKCFCLYMVQWESTVRLPFPSF